MSWLPDDLRQRTRDYALSVIRVYVELPKGREEIRMFGRQALSSGTSVVAHCREAARVRSDAAFCSKLDGVLQEANETRP